MKRQYNSITKHVLFHGKERPRYFVCGHRRPHHITFIFCLLHLYNLGSSDSILLSMPAARSKTLGDRAFMVAAPRLRNSLPKELHAITNVNSFKAHIKTYLLKTLYWWAILYSLLTCMHIYSFYFLFILFHYYFLMHYLLFVSFK